MIIEDLKQIGFTDMRHGWVEANFGKFYIEASPDGYFFIYSDKSGDREAAPFDYNGIDKFKALVKAHEEYFK